MGVGFDNVDIREAGRLGIPVRLKSIASHVRACVRVRVCAVKECVAPPHRAARVPHRPDGSSGQRGDISIAVAGDEHPRLRNGGGG